MGFHKPWLEEFPFGKQGDRLCTAARVDSIAVGYLLSRNPRVNPASSGAWAIHQLQKIDEYPKSLAQRVVKKAMSI